VSGCVFCGIVAGELEASVVGEDETVVAFMDIRPVSRGHLLVVPRRHAASLGELDEESQRALFPAAVRAAGALRASGLPCEGVNVWVADGEAAGQEVFHVHLHVLPRFAGDGFGIDFPDGYGAVRARAELERDAAAIREAWPR
jgi:histidine triad (HIT) family protein